jgi:hypothetical protein
MDGVATLAVSAAESTEQTGIHPILQTKITQKSFPVTEAMEEQLDLLIKSKFR